MRQLLIKNSIFVLFILVSISIAQIVYSTDDLNSFTVWTAPALESIAQDDNHQIKYFKSITKPKPHRLSQQIRLKAARGESESFQIAIQAPKNQSLGNVDVLVSDLRGTKGAVISRDNVTLYRQHYIHITPTADSSSANPTKGAAWYPDALIPFRDPQSNQDLKGAEFDAVPVQSRSKSDSAYLGRYFCT